MFSRSPSSSLQAEDSLVVGTSEGAVHQFQLLPVKVGSAERQWVRTKPFQYHTHDVRAVVHTATALISGGRVRQGAFLTCGRGACLLRLGQVCQPAAFFSSSPFRIGWAAGDPATHGEGGGPEL